MERYRRKKLIIIIALVLTISGLSIGFAAFTSVLTISSTATVTPDESTFSVLFSSSNTEQVDGILSMYSSIGATGESATINGTTVSGLKANFTEPGQTVGYKFYSHNVGSYIAYLRNVVFGGGKTCTPGTGTTASLVEAACDDITIKVLVGGATYTQDSDVYSHSLAIDEYKEVKVIISYLNGGDVADGDFSVEFGDISLIYSSAIYDDSEKTLIEFTINGETYQTIEGMTWGEWAESKYSEGLTLKVYVDGFQTSLSSDLAVAYYSSNGRWERIYDSSFIAVSSESEIAEMGIYGSALYIDG